MAWTIEKHNGAALVHMNSNKVNRQNEKFIDDLEDTLDRLDADFAGLPVVLTSANEIFSAGFDFDYWFPRIHSADVASVGATYHRFKKINQRLFTLDRPTVAAINGHAYAGGLITAFCCDFRVAAKGSLRMGLNEVAIGLAMPAHFTEIIRYAVGTPLAAEMNLLARVYTLDQALAKGIVHETVEQNRLIDRAIEIATEIAPDCRPAYAFSKRAMQVHAVQLMERESEAIDRDYAATWCCEGAQSATKRTYALLKAKA